MKISIQGEEYPLFEAIGGAQLGDLKTLKQVGVTVPTIKAAFERVLKLMESGGSGLDLFEDEDYIQNMIGVVYLALRGAGHNITLADAERVPGAEVFLVAEVEDADPKDEAEPPATSTT